MRILTTFAVTCAVIALPVSAGAMMLDCQLRSFDHGGIVHRLRIGVSSNYMVSVHEQKPATSRSRKVERARTVRFHHYSNPVEMVHGKEHRLEQAHSVLLLASVRHGTEVAPDILVIDWGKGSLKTSSSYQREFTTNWHCTRQD